MAFVRAKKIKDKYLGEKIAYYLVENNRENGKVRQRVLIYLGPCDSLKGALEYWGNARKEAEAMLQYWREKATATRQRIPSAWIDRNGGEVPQGKHRGIKFRNNICRQYWAWTEAAEQSKKHLAEIDQRLVKIRHALEA